MLAVMGNATDLSEVKLSLLLVGNALDLNERGVLSLVALS